MQEYKVSDKEKSWWGYTHRELLKEIIDSKMTGKIAITEMVDSMIFPIAFDTSHQVAKEVGLKSIKIATKEEQMKVVCEFTSKTLPLSFTQRIDGAITKSPTGDIIISKELNKETSSFRDINLILNGKYSQVSLTGKERILKGLPKNTRTEHVLGKSPILKNEIEQLIGQELPPDAEVAERPDLESYLTEWQ